MITLPSYLQGRFQTGTGAPATLINPSTGEAIAQCSTGGLDLVGALAFARDKGGPALRAMTFAQRGALLKRMSAALHESREVLIEGSLQNGGGTRGDAKFDVDGAIGTLAYYARLGEKLGEQMGDRTTLVEGAGEPLSRSPRLVGYHVRTSKTGVALHINAFNFPAWGLAEKAACALLAGVPVIAKPATSTALVTVRCVEILVEKAQLPEGALQLITGSVGDLLDHLQPDDVVSFTGSADTAAMLRSKRPIVERSVRMNVEADSLNSVVLGPDVEEGSDVWHLFLKHVTTEMTQKSGQKCTATRRIFVPRAKADALQEALAERLNAIRVGDPAAEGTEMGPLATVQQLKDAHAGLEKLQAAGARIVAAGGPVPATGCFLSPKLLRHDDAKAAGAVHEHEVFGPVSTLLPYDDVKDVPGLVALGQGSLVCSVYSDDKDLIGTLITGLSPWSGRLLIGTAKIADQIITSGMVLPSCVHGGPGRAGGGEELGGERGLHFYMQRTAIQGDRALLDRVLGVGGDRAAPAASAGQA